ncbi:hypothetical protein KK083_29320 [Fulvivirgaceae bacterium PWU4]|uniref:Lipoprotein n=1 Tax=Chryseosolibacter histidini TaxID=2782349 RepID=A0AAP2DT43_9BACT|nr:hypothetical protein [Chryseosolibacter histidini]MBT1701029.1 hypothetical protein [Chryseosolibacter histidini]
MTLRIIRTLLLSAVVAGVIGCGGDGSQNDDACSCDTTKFLYTIRSGEFNRIPEYDTITFAAGKLYDLSANENKRLWYRDIENPDTTKFTRYWNDYLPNNYHADHLDFVNYYENKPETEIAFQFGPNMDLWAYHIFVIKKSGCCYLATRSYFRHARFVYKAFAIIDKSKVDSLYAILEPISKIPMDADSSWRYRGYFADNRNQTKFYVDFETEMEADHRTPKKEVKSLYNFVDNSIKWVKTYD